jgi:hypothetical protein
MPKPDTHRLMRAETMTAIGLFFAATCFLFPTAELKPISALLPATMLTAILVFAGILLIADQRKAAAGEAAKPVTKAPKRVLWAFLLIVAYALAVDFVGFYISTAVSIPVVAYAFGYRNPLGLAIATLIMLSMIYLIFGFAMSQEFPAGRLWPK